MASKKTKVVDGFTAIRAAQEAARHGRGDPLRPDGAAKKPPDSGGSADPRAGSRIGRSVMPTKREIICPECAMPTEITGNLQMFVCNHCRHRMQLRDLQIPAGEWSGEIEVGGTVIVPADAVLKGGKIVANDIVLQGAMAGTEIRACRRFTIGAAAKPDWVRLKSMDLELGVGVNLTPGKPIEGRHMLLHGKFSGNAILGGTLTVHADGDFSGKIKAAGLRVEEGGGLRAQLDVNPGHAPPPLKPKSRPPPKPNPKLRPPPPKASAAKPSAPKKKASEPRKREKE